MPSAGAAAAGKPADGAPADGAQDGPAITALRGVAAWTVTFIRCVVIVYVAVQVIIWHTFYAADAWRLAGPAAAVVWQAAVVTYLRRRWPPWQLAGLDSGAGVLLALGAGWCVPPAMRGDTANWLYIVMVGQLFVPAWLAPTAVAAPLAFASGAAYWAGAGAVPAAASGGSSPAGAGILLLVIAVAAWFARRMLERSAAVADVAAARADRDAREQHVALSRSRERREHERLLHDTVLNTLTALARPGPGGTAYPVPRDTGYRGARDGVVDRCRRDVALMEYALSDPGGPATAAGRPYGGLLYGIEAAAIEMRARGLDVHVNVAGAARQALAPVAEDPGAPRSGARELAGAALADPLAASEPAPVVPVPVAVAMSYAVREALANVESHAGTGEAWVEVSLGPPGGEPELNGGTEAVASLEVTVRDAGAGFDPARVDPVRLGLRRSIIERLAEWGGRASIRSAPGEGTVVSLRWTAPALARLQAVGAARAPRRAAGGRSSRFGLARRGPADGVRGPW
jgi:signal transduction histidine kinase